ncbi:MAG: gluconokinase [Hyphomicrobiales bacterium]|nr:gluconokinase [Hyphomicrobiales bacterium]
MTEDLPAVILLMGVAGSGKTTIGKKLSEMLGWPYADADEFHPAANVTKMRAGHPLTDEDRKPWLAAIASHIDKTIAVGGHAIVSCSALKRSYRDVIVGARKGVRIVLLEGSHDLIAARMGARKNHFMPTSLLDSQFATLERPTPDEHAIVVSVAGTPDEIAANVIAKLGR